MDVSLSPERLTHFEWRVRQVYLVLSDRVDLAEELRFFCRCMAEDERKDISVLERGTQIRQTMERVPSVPEAALVEVEQSVVTAEALASQAVLTTDDVLRLALHIEGSTLKRLDLMWLHGFGPTFGSLLLELAPDAEIRIRRLIEAIHTLSTDPNLREEVAVLWAAH
jgi:hypothetical protein